MLTQREKTRRVYIGKVPIGGGVPISVQSMCSTDTRDVKATLSQIKRLEKAGCEIVRLAVLDQKAAEAISIIKKVAKIPLVADIHFDYRLALRALDSGVDKLRINPGTIGALWKVKEVVKASRERKIPIRIGVNAASLPKSILSKYGKATPTSMVEAALEQVKILEELDYQEIVVSLKASDVPTSIEAYKLFSEKRDYPLHLGVTEVGTPRVGSIKSAIGIGTLLFLGLGDTIRVSLTGDPVEEVKIGYEILKSLNLREYGPTLISCPTCGRMEIDLLPIVKQVEKRLDKLKAPIKVAVMGCVVNGPGEAKEADIGIAGGRGVGLIFRKGKVIKKVKEKDIVKSLMGELEEFLKG
jgi:(E)-4-hydroxy-3-methylbut-2-enyl-diphosphate synthase